MSHVKLSPNITVLNCFEGATLAQPSNTLKHGS